MRIVLFLCSCLVITFLLARPARPESHRQHNEGSAQIRTFRGIFAALDSLATTDGIRFGLEALDDACEANATLQVDLADKNIPQVLNQFTNRCPAYTWSLGDSVYDVFPKGQDQLAEMNIALYYVRDATADNNSDAIDQLPELREWLALHNARRREFLGGRRSNSTRRITLDLPASSFRSVLNHVITSLGDSYWMISHYGPGGRDIGIYL
jgi:hypothetical protein